MSLLGRILAAARQLPLGRPSFGWPLGGLIARASGCLPSRELDRHGPRGAAPPNAKRAEESVAFTIAVIALGAKMAKADGTVSRDEVYAFREVFQVPAAEEAHLRRVFDIARRSTAGFESYARQVGRLFAGQRGLLEDLLGGLFYIALADGRLCPAEDAYLRQVAHHLGIDTVAYGRIRASFGGIDDPSGQDSGDDPHAVLGVASDASAEEIQHAHRRLVRSHHPDLMLARGMSAERVAAATARVARINAARERLLHARGLVGPRAAPGMQPA